MLWLSLHWFSLCSSSINMLIYVFDFDTAALGYDQVCFRLWAYLINSYFYTIVSLGELSKMESHNGPVTVSRTCCLCQQGKSSSHFNFVRKVTLRQWCLLIWWWSLCRHFVRHPLLYIIARRITWWDSLDVASKISSQFIAFVWYLGSLNL